MWFGKVQKRLVCKCVCVCVEGEEERELGLVMKIGDLCVKMKFYKVKHENCV